MRTLHLSGIPGNCLRTVRRTCLMCDFIFAKITGSSASAGAESLIRKLGAGAGIQEAGTPVSFELWKTKYIGPLPSPILAIFAVSW